MIGNRNSIWFHLSDVVLNIVIIVGVVMLIRTFLVSPFQVKGNSMVSTLEDGEYIIINKLAYFLDEPQRGDIAVLVPPNEERRHYVKRIIGVPGDTVMIRNGKVYLQTEGQEEYIELSEPYLNERNADHTFNHPTGNGNSESPAIYEVPEGSYFVLGDNRQGSSDSRSFKDLEGNDQPFVEGSRVKGRVWFILLPLSKIQAFAAPKYGL